MKASKLPLQVRWSRSRSDLERERQRGRLVSSERRLETRRGTLWRETGTDQHPLFNIVVGILGLTAEEEPSGENPERKSDAHHDVCRRKRDRLDRFGAGRRAIGVGSNETARPSSVDQIEGGER